MQLDFAVYLHRYGTPSPRTKIRSHLTTLVPCDAAALRRCHIYFCRWPSKRCHNSSLVMLAA